MAASCWSSSGQADAVAERVGPDEIGVVGVGDGVPVGGSVTIDVCTLVDGGRVGVAVPDVQAAEDTATTAAVSSGRARRSPVCTIPDVSEPYGRGPYRERVHRSGFACFVGRPNAGKSTLTNALVGTKIVITSDKPQTTRHAVRGIVNRPDAQLVLVDTPGLHRPRTLLGERLNDVVRATLTDVDVVGFCVPADRADRAG